VVAQSWRGKALNTALLVEAAAAPPWLARRDPRLRLAAALLFALVTVSLQTFPALLAALALALALVAAGGTDWRPLLRRLLPLEGLMLALLLLLPFTVAGTPWFAVGPLQASHEGLELALHILLRANAVLVMLLAMLGTLEPTTLGHALGRLGVPQKLVHLFLLTVRYIELIHDEYRRLRNAMRARAFVPRSDAHGWRSLGWLIGMLLVRSLERAQRVLAAMKCRGFHGRLYLLADYRWGRGDSAAALAASLLLGGLLLLEHAA
jgi:cobalt/nickel transport system permease protein